MLNKNWTPDLMKETDSHWSNLKLPTGENISHSDAERLMLKLQEASIEWADHLVNATYFHQMAEVKTKSLFSMAFLSSDGKSDRQKETIAKSNIEVKNAEIKEKEAEAHLLFAKLRYDDAVRSHHAIKKIFEVAASERKYL